MSFPYEVDFHSKVSETWPASGKVILATFDPDFVVLYQAYKPSIAEWAVTHKTFLGCPDFRTERMTWLKPNFLWMMFRSGWARKPGQERILAIQVRRSGFEDILRHASKKPSVGEEDDVRLQWDPDHDIFGEKVERRAIQLGIRGKILQKFLTEWIKDIHDVTNFVQEQYAFIEKKDLHLLKVPFEKIYKIEEDGLRSRIQADF